MFKGKAVPVSNIISGWGIKPFLQPRHYQTKMETFIKI